MAHNQQLHETCNGAIDQPTRCPDCAAAVRTTDGETWCGACGLVVDEYRLDHAFEPTSAEDGPDRERTGAPLTVGRHDRGLSTEIGYGTNATDPLLPATKRRQLGRLRREHNRAQWRTTAERNLAHGLGEIKRVAAVLDLPRSVRDRAAVLFRAAQREGLMHGRSIDGIAAASVYAACRDAGILRTAREAAAAGGTTEDRIRHDYGILNVELGLTAPPYPAEQFVSRFAANLGVPTVVRVRAVAILDRADRAGHRTGSRPSSLAAAALYLAAGHRLTQNAVAAACGTSAATIRARARDLEPFTPHTV